MIKIEYPEYIYKIREEAGKELIFDVLRKSWVRLTPEEWVRQNFLQYLVLVKKYPSSLIAVEKELMLGELKKRFDILVYDFNHRPWMMVECKAMEIALDEKVLYTRCCIIIFRCRYLISSLPMVNLWRDFIVTKRVWKCYLNCLNSGSYCDKNADAYQLSTD